MPASTNCSALKRSRSEEHTSELQSLRHLVCRLLLEKKCRLASAWRWLRGLRRWTICAPRDTRARCCCFFFLRIRCPPRSPLFPYTTLFRSVGANSGSLGQGATRRGICGDLLSGRHRHRSEEHTSELQSLRHLVCRLLLE